LKIEELNTLFCTLLSTEISGGLGVAMLCH